MEKNKEVVKPIDATEYMTEEQREEYEEFQASAKSWSESTTKEKAIGIIFLIWFFGSILALIITANINAYLTVMIFGQYFFVFGLIAFFGKPVGGGSGKPIGALFALIGFACILIPLLMMITENSAVTINWGIIIAVLMLLVFIIVGLGFVISHVKSGHGEPVGTSIMGLMFVLIPAAILGLIFYHQPVIIEPATEDPTAQYQDEIPEHEVFETGTKVSVQINENESLDFYVLNDPGLYSSKVTLIAEENIGYSAFNNDFTDGNEFTGSLIEQKLQELTLNWTNVSTKRLIEVEELEDSGYTYTQTENRCPTGDCPENYTYVKKDSFLYNENEFYWTMTKVTDPEITNNTNHYVYMVDLDGCIEQHIVGYEPGGQYNQQGTFFDNYGIRPVIEVFKIHVTSGE